MKEEKIMTNLKGKLLNLRDKARTVQGRIACGAGTAAGIASSAVVSVCTSLASTSGNGGTSGVGSIMTDSVTTGIQSGFNEIVTLIGQVCAVVVPSLIVAIITYKGMQVMLKIIKSALAKIG